MGVFVKEDSRSAFHDHDVQVYHRVDMKYL